MPHTSSTISRASVSSPQSPSSRAAPPLTVVSTLTRTRPARRRSSTFRSRALRRTHAWRRKASNPAGPSSSTRSLPSPRLSRCPPGRPWLRPRRGRWGRPRHGCARRSAWPRSGAPAPPPPRSGRGRCAGSAAAPGGAVRRVGGCPERVHEARRRSSPPASCSVNRPGVGHPPAGICARRTVRQPGSWVLTPMCARCGPRACSDERQPAGAVPVDALTPRGRPRSVTGARHAVPRGGERAASPGSMGQTGVQRWRSG